MAGARTRTRGEVVWAPFKSLWNTAMYGIALVLGPLYFSWSALAVFLGLSYSTLLLGHSVGMHRRLIHRLSLTDSSRRR